MVRLLKRAHAICDAKSSDDIQAYYLLSEQKKTKEDLIKDLCTKEMLETCVDVSKVVIPQEPGFHVTDWEWLDGDHMKMLIARERDGMLKGVSTMNVMVYDDLSNLGSEFDSNKELFDDAVQKTVQDPEHKVLFCIGTMQNNKKQGGSVTGSMGHWFTLVWAQDRNYVMDSLHDKNRLEDERVIKILGVFEARRAELMKK